MPWRFDHHLVGSNSIHLIIDPFAFSVQFSFYSESGELIGDNAKGPTRSVRRGSIVSKGNDLRRSSIFVAFTEGAESADGSSLLWNEIRRSSTPLCRDDHPSPMNGIFSQFGHRGFFFRREFMPKRGNFF
jgi:hypothetical protein